MDRLISDLLGLVIAGAFIALMLYVVLCNPDAQSTEPPDPGNIVQFTGAWDADECDCDDCAREIAA